MNISREERACRQLQEAVRTLVQLAVASNGDAKRGRPSNTRQLQGRYMGLLRNMPPVSKREARRLRKRFGLAKAVAFARAVWRTRRQQEAA